MAVDSVLNLDQGWTTAEFNVFGDCCLSEANFSSGTTVVVSTTVGDGKPNAPSCVSGGTTGETNNLTLVSAAALGVQPLPAVSFTESNVLSTTSSCVAAAGDAGALQAISSLLLLN